MSWLEDVQALRPGDPCEFHYPAREDALPGIVKVAAGSSYWTVWSTSESGKEVTGLYIEHIKAPGGLSCYDDEDMPA